MTYLIYLLQIFIIIIKLNILINLKVDILWYYIIIKVICGNLISKVIIRVAVGSKKPLDAGSQHTQNYTEALKKMITNIKLVELHNAKDIKQAFETAYLRKGSTIIVEWGDYYSDK